MLTGVSKYTKNTTAYARSYFQVIPFLLNEKGGYWTLNHENKNVLRDFSKTSRIGELAQGINYLVSISELGAISVYDYKEFIKEKCGSKVKTPGRLPDYVLYYRDGEYGVLESKGLVGADPTQSLFNAKVQYEKTYCLRMDIRREIHIQRSKVAAFSTAQTLE